MMAAELLEGELDVTKPIALRVDPTASCSIIATREGKLFPLEVEARWEDGSTERFFVDPTDGVGIKVRGRGVFNFVNRE